MVLCFELLSRETTSFFGPDVPRQAADIGARMVPPALSSRDRLWLLLRDAINLATLGILLGVAFAVPVAFLALAARTTRVASPRRANAAAAVSRTPGRNSSGRMSQKR